MKLTIDCPYGWTCYCCRLAQRYIAGELGATNRPQLKDGVPLIVAGVLTPHYPADVVVYGTPEHVRVRLTVRPE